MDDFKKSEMIKAVSSQIEVRTVLENPKMALKDYG